jgi:hypothetical protein
MGCGAKAMARSACWRPMGTHSLLSTPPMCADKHQSKTHQSLSRREVWAPFHRLPQVCNGGLVVFPRQRPKLALSTGHKLPAAYISRRKEGRTAPRRCGSTAAATLLVDPILHSKYLTDQPIPLATASSEAGTLMRSVKPIIASVVSSCAFVGEYDGSIAKGRVTACAVSRSKS